MLTGDQDMGADMSTATAPSALDAIRRHWIECQAEDGFHYWPHRSGCEDAKTLFAALDAAVAEQAELLAALREARLLAEEITDLEGREGMTDSDFAEQVISLAQEKLQVFRAALAKAEERR